MCKQPHTCFEAYKLGCLYVHVDTINRKYPSPNLAFESAPLLEEKCEEFLQYISRKYISRTILSSQIVANTSLLLHEKVSEL